MSEVKKERKEKKDKKDKEGSKKDKKDKKGREKGSPGKLHELDATPAASPIGSKEVFGKEDGDAENFDHNREIVEALCRQPANSICADCNCTGGTRWASVNHGVFVCIRCSGIHRSLGVHVSKVKSTNMDKWLLNEVKMMQQIGNRYGKDLYESRFPRGQRALKGDESEAAVASFIKEKYAEKAFSSEDCAEQLRRIQKSTGYRKKTGGSGGSDKKDSGMGELLGGRKQKKQKTVSGAFGEVNVLPDEHDAKLARILAHFGIGATAADAEEEEATATTATATAAAEKENPAVEEEKPAEAEEEKEKEEEDAPKATSEKDEES